MAEGEFLGEPTFVAIGGGRFRCVETGHELFEFEKAKYAASKKCKEALFDRALADGRSPLGFFEQSPDRRDRIICKLTNAEVNKNEKAVWRHVLGKSFNKKLSLEEEVDEKEERKQQETLKELGDEDERSSPDKNAITERDDTACDMDEDPTGFWVPPAAEAKKDGYEHDDGRVNGKLLTGDEEQPQAKTEKKKKKQKQKEKKQKEKEKKEKKENESLLPESDANLKDRKRNKKKKKDVMAVDGSKDENAVQETDLKQRVKRGSLAVGPSSFASRKKKRKTISNE